MRDAFRPCGGYSWLKFKKNKFGEYLAAGSTPRAISLQNTQLRWRSNIRPYIPKNAKNVEELKVRGSERRTDRRSRGGTEVKERKTLLRGTEQAGYSTKTWKGEPVNGRTSHQMTDMETEQGMYRELTGKKGG